MPEKTDFPDNLINPYSLSDYKCTYSNQVRVISTKSELFLDFYMTSTNETNKEELSNQHVQRVAIPIAIAESLANLIKDAIHKQDEVQITEWLALSEKSFDFWDNEQDALYDNL